MWLTQYGSAVWIGVVGGLLLKPILRPPNLELRTPHRMLNKCSDLRNPGKLTSTQTRTPAQRMLRVAHASVLAATGVRANPSSSSSRLYGKGRRAPFPCPTVYPLPSASRKPACSASSLLSLLCMYMYILVWLYLLSIQTNR